MTLPTRRIQEQCTTLDTVSTTVDAATPCDDTALTSVVVARSKALSVPPCSKVPDVEVCRWSQLLSRHGHWRMTVYGAIEWSATTFVTCARAMTKVTSISGTMRVHPARQETWRPYGKVFLAVLGARARTRCRRMFGSGPMRRVGCGCRSAHLTLVVGCEG